MARSDAVEQLRKVPLFAALDRKDLETLSHFVREQSYEPGQTIVKEGDKGHGLYIIKDGKVSIRKGNRAIRQMGPGDFFGEIAILDDGPRTADVVADSRTDCLTLSSWETRPLLMQSSGMSYAMLREVVRRLRDATPVETH
jgi:CRP-like cAMP-binding protein